MGDLSALFAPRGIIVVGASRSPGKLGTAMTDALSGAQTPVALVNARGGDGIEPDVASAARRLEASGAYPDLVVSCVPASATAAVVADAAAVGARAALVCAGGFAEVGGAGIALQQDLGRAAHGRVRVLGPNTSGFFVPGSDLRASFVPGVSALAPGKVAVVASSGGVNHMISFRLAEAGVGVSLGVGIGAGFDVTHADVLEYLAEDDTTTAVALHLESVIDGAALLEAVRRAAAAKPVIAFVVGRRSESAFAQSHTGALATSWRTARSALAQAGAVIVNDEGELVAAAAALSLVRLPPLSDAGVALITGQAGPGLIIDDHAESDHWRLPPLGERTRARVAELLPPLTFQANPVDTGRPGDTFPEIVRAVAADEGIDLVAVYALTEPVLDLPGAIRTASPEVPVILGMDGSPEDVELAKAAAAALAYPFVTGPSALSWAVRAVVADARGRHLASEEPAAVGPVVDTVGAWDEVRAKELLERVGLRTPDRRTASDSDAAVEALREIGGPVAVKLVDAEVLHKTEVGGVHLGVDSTEQMTTAIDALRQGGASRFLIERMAPAGVDLVVSVRRDPVFGPVALVGLGGTAAEAMADVAIRTLPMSRNAARAMVDDLRARDLLFGWRGGPTLDRDQLADQLEALAGVMESNPTIAEIEINPLRVTSDGLVAIDALVVTSKEV